MSLKQFNEAFSFFDTYLKQNKNNPEIIIYANIASVLALKFFYRPDPLLYRDLERDTPWNTYMHTGLPPGPWRAIRKMEGRSLGTKHESKLLAELMKMKFEEGIEKLWYNTKNIILNPDLSPGKACF